MDNYIHKELERRFREIKAAHADDANGKGGRPKSIKSVTTLALEAYMAESSEIIQKEKLDKRFAHYAASQIRLFLFAGTDTTTSIMVYIYHMLAKHPE